MDGHNFERLSEHILSLSFATSFQDALPEWVLMHVEISEDFDNCPCGQRIREHCYIRNTWTNQETYVGNVCIQRFMGVETGNLFDGLKRIRDNPTANANEAVISYALKNGYLHQGEPAFLTRTKNKRKLTLKQLSWKEKINRRILQKTVVRRRGDAS